MENKFICPSFVCVKLIPEGFFGTSFLRNIYTECSCCSRTKAQALLQKNIIGALTGLSRAAEGNEPSLTEETDSALLLGLCNSFAGSLQEDSVLYSSVEALHQEKYSLSPSCQFCEAKCGRTDDYDFSQSFNFSTEILFLKVLILYNIQMCARKIFYTKHEGIKKEAVSFLYRSTSILGMDDWDKDSLFDFVVECSKKNEAFFSDGTMGKFLFVPESFISNFVDSSNQKIIKENSSFEDEVKEIMQDFIDADINFVS